jgi:polyphosphate glucokinase
MKKARRKPVRRRRSAKGPQTLAIDIGGTNIKASVLDRDGAEMTKRIQIRTPHPAPPAAVLSLLEEMIGRLPAFNRISVGFPGVVKRGRIITAPNLGTSDWRDFPLATRLEQRWHKPARVLNDAEVQGFGVISDKGLECVLTLGTGFGSAIYRDGDLMPHLELGQHPAWKSRTYDEYLGVAALRRKGVARWNRRVKRMLTIVRTLLNFDHLYLGGGNAAKINFELPADVTIVSNEAGITGGIRLWDRRFDRLFR